MKRKKSPKNRQQIRKICRRHVHEIKETTKQQEKTILMRKKLQREKLTNNSLNEAILRILKGM